MDEDRLAKILHDALQEELRPIKIKLDTIDSIKAKLNEMDIRLGGMERELSEVKVRVDDSYGLLRNCSKTLQRRKK